MSRIVTVLDRTNSPIYVDSHHAHGVLVEVLRPYGCLAVCVGQDGKIVLEAQDGQGEVLDTHEIDPDQFVHPPTDKDRHDLGDSSGG